MAMPWGAACGSLSGMVGMPVEFEKRMVRGVELVRCCAEVRSAAPVEGV